MIKSLVSDCLLVYAISHIDFHTNFYLCQTKKLKKIRSFSTFGEAGVAAKRRNLIMSCHFLFFEVCSFYVFSGRGGVGLQKLNNRRQNISF